MSRMNQQVGRGKGPSYRGDHYLHAATEEDLRKQIKREIMHNPRLAGRTLIIEEMAMQTEGLRGRWRAHWEQ